MLVCGAFGGPVAAKLSTAGSNFEDAGSPSVAARDLIESRSGVSPDAAVVVLLRANADVPQGDNTAMLELIQAF